jgi:hypothetical protein
MLNFIKKIFPPKVAPKRDERICIALDESVGFAKTEQLKRMGYNVVAIARHAEKDVDWLNRAFANGALFVVSPDLDIPNLIERENYPMIWIDYLHVPKEAVGVKHWAQYVDKRIKAKIKFLKNHFGGTK